MKRRVAITGLGAVSPLGVGLPALMDGLERGASGIVRVPALAAVDGLRCQLAGLVPAFEAPDLPRRHRRSMSPMSVFAYLACREALAMAGLEVESARDSLCLILGSTVGSPQTLEAFFADYLPARSLSAIKSTTFFKAMGHAAAANVSQALGLAGPLLAPTAACATGCLAVGLAYDLIAGGRQEMILAGGTDEFHPLVPATFDIMNAASVGFNHSPDQAPRPFDRRRDGVVCAEGAGVLLLEAIGRGPGPRREGAGRESPGYASSADVSHIAHPEAAAIRALPAPGPARRRRCARGGGLREHARHRHAVRRRGRGPGRGQCLRARRAGLELEGPPGPHHGRQRRPGAGRLGGDGPPGTARAHPQLIRRRSRLRGPGPPARTGLPGGIDGG